MPLKLSVGLTRKQGLPHFGSVGASCHVEVELSADALKETPSFLSEAERALDACRQVVEKELARPSGSAGNSGNAAIVVSKSFPSFADATALPGAEELAPPSTLQLPCGGERATVRLSRTANRPPRDAASVAGD